MSRENKDYLIKGTELICDKGQYENKFEVSEKSVEIQGYSVANQTDNIAGKHIKSFGSCSVMGTCKMETDLRGQFLIWHETLEGVVMCGGETLLEDSYCFCPYSGKITVFESNQIDPKEAMEELFGVNTATVEALENAFGAIQLMAVNQLENAFDEFAENFYRNEEERIRKSINNPYMQNNYGLGSHNTTTVNKIEPLPKAKVRELNLNSVYMQMQTGGTGWNPNVARNGEKIYKDLSIGNNAYMRMQTGLSEQMLEAYLRGEVKPNIVPPEFGIRELFKRGTSKEGIYELYNKGVDPREKKMLPGLFGGDVLTAANLAGYTYYRPDEVQEIVESLTPDGKAAYLLHTNKNMSLDKVRFAVETGALIYGTYKSSRPGKVKTGSKLNVLDDEIEEFELFRRGKNTGEFEELEELMTKKNVMKRIDEAGMNFDGVKIKIDRNKDMVGKGYLGWTSEDGKRIILYPDAFKNTELLVSTLGHEKIHVLQVLRDGPPMNDAMSFYYESVAERSEGLWWARYKARNGVK